MPSRLSPAAYSISPRANRLAGSSAQNPSRAQPSVVSSPSNSLSVENRPPNSNYWKSSPFRLAEQILDPATNPDTGDPQVFAAGDYLVAYWLGRYLGAW